LKFTTADAPERFFFRVSITGDVEAGSYGVSHNCRGPEACDMSTKKFVHISTVDDRLRVLIYEGKEVIFAGKDADGEPEGGQLSGSASYSSDPDLLEGTFTMTLE